ncbi:hypothetical protein M3223_12670 [Paenibacillus pasadenensis]|uniref:hypothetical protein n=1 Tax=Paenibacillus pasadenensis TaxID=217090 RepID=UPI002041519A|nr:hypothetical protein [Paenibacillus pasadenensis]MCM3748208.1 hypothetical protein [Paenibacillus pasadenensis]
MKKVDLEGFEQAHELWLNAHLRARKGEGKDRLKRGHAHGEILFLKEIWWPLFGSFDDLHPEYEVLDWRGAPCYLDFAWLPGIHRINIDVKGYGPHVQQTDRTRYSRELLREIYLQTLGYRNISIPYDSLQNDPSLIRQMMKNLLGGVTAAPVQEAPVFSLIELGLLRFARSCNGYIYPAEAAKSIGTTPRTAAKYLKSLCERGVMREIGANNLRIKRYKYVKEIYES